jgi:hypothetical protein
MGQFVHTIRALEQAMSAGRSDENGTVFWTWDQQQDQLHHADLQRYCEAHGMAQPSRRLLSTKDRVDRTYMSGLRDRRGAVRMSLAGEASKMLPVVRWLEQIVDFGANPGAIGHDRPEREL